MSQWVCVLAAYPGAQHMELPMWEAVLSRVWKPTSVEAHAQFRVSAHSSLVGVGQGWGAAGSAIHFSLFCPLLIHMTSPRTSIICIPSSQGEFCTFHTICTNTSNAKFHLTHFGKYGPGLKLVSPKRFPCQEAPSGSSGGRRLEAFIPHPSLRHYGPIAFSSLYLNRII